MAPELERILGSGSRVHARARARAEALRPLRRHGVLVPRSIELLPDGRVLARLPVARGQSLAALSSQRPLAAGECVTVAMSVARSLEALHAAGLAHGDVSATNILVDGSRVTLVDVMGTVAGPDGATPGCAAPERGDGPSAASDVYSLGAVLSAVASAEARPVIDAWTEPMLRDEPQRRPSAADVAVAFARCVPPVPVRRLGHAVAADMRARVASRTVRLRAGRWWRAERATVRASPIVGLAILAVAIGVPLVPSAKAAMAAPPPTPAIPVAAAAFSEPADAAVDLTRRRFGALSHADGTALIGLDALGSEAAKADREVAARLSRGALRFDGLEVVSVDAVELSRTPGAARVRVTSAFSSYTVTDEGTMAVVPAASAVAVLEMRVTQRGWTVERILPAS